MVAASSNHNVQGKLPSFSSAILYDNAYGAIELFASFNGRCYRALDSGNFERIADLPTWLHVALTVVQIVAFPLTIIACLFKLGARTQLQPNQNQLDLNDRLLRTTLGSIKEWYGLAHKPFDPSKYRNKFSDSQKTILQNWLLRLKSTEDFTAQRTFLPQRALIAQRTQFAQTVVGILETLATNESFRDDFFAQAGSNNERCGDRAGMAFNEIFVAWKLATLPANASLQSKIQLMAAVAKTATLRACLQSLLASNQYRRHTPGTTLYEESVEAYLYYEIRFKDRLNLVTAINNMGSSGLGPRSWINEQKLINSVNQNYMDHLIEMTAFKPIAESNPLFQSMWKEVNDTLVDQLEALEVEKETIGMSSQRYLNRIKDIENSREREWRRVAAEWAQQYL